jgi:hypothetical protein
LLVAVLIAPFETRLIGFARYKALRGFEGLDPKPHRRFEWKEIAAALTSSLFAYSLEINGAASMGAAALEAPTTKLRDYPVLDVTKLKATQRKKLVSLAEIGFIRSGGQADGTSSSIWPSRRQSWSN